MLRIEAIKESEMRNALLLGKANPNSSLDNKIIVYNLRTQPDVNTSRTLKWLRWASKRYSILVSQDANKL
jgi:hypothetical protein